MIATLERDMEAAAEKLDFEKATTLRNLLKDLQETSKPIKRFTRTSLPSGIDPQNDVIELRDALGLMRAPRTMECFDISNISDSHIVASMVRFRDGVPEREHYRRYRITTTRGQNDFASMAEVIRRRYRRLLLDTAKLTPDLADSQEPLAETVERIVRTQQAEGILPDLIIVDGGKGQLGMACRELQSLGLHEQPIIGLAKVFEEIYRPGEMNSLRLDKNSGALRLLQRIRDEAHRVANGYNELLLRRRISESQLDTIPGISSTRKKALLTRFGSLSRLRKATQQELAATPGISPLLANTLFTHLQNPQNPIAHKPSTNPPCSLARHSGQK